MFTIFACHVLQNLAVTTKKSGYNKMSIRQSGKVCTVSLIVAAHCLVNLLLKFRTSLTRPITIINTTFCIVLIPINGQYFYLDCNVFSFRS